MILSYSKNFIFIHNDRTGGTSIEEALTPYLNWNDFIFGGQTFGNEMEELYIKHFGQEYFKSKGLLKHSDVKRIKQEIGSIWDSMYKFSTVRDPEKIMISLYYYIKEYRWQEENTYPMYNLTKLGLDEFIIKSIQGGYEPTIPQSIRLDNDDSIDLYNIDNIHNSWPTILNKIGISDKVNLPIINKTKKIKGVELKNSTKDLIQNHFKDDYIMLKRAK